MIPGWSLFETIRREENSSNVFTLEKNRQPKQSSQTVYIVRRVKLTINVGINLKTISMSSWILQRFLKHNSLSDLLRLILTLTKKSFFRNTDVILHCIEGFVEVWAKGISTVVMPFMSSLIHSLLPTYRERTAAKIWNIHMYVYFSNNSASET